MRIHAIALLAGLVIVAAPSGRALAGAAPEEALSVLQKRGYSNIKIEPGDAPGYRASACKGNTRFSVTLDAKSNIVDVDPRGACAGQTDKYAAAPPPEMQSRGAAEGGGYGTNPAYDALEVVYAPLLNKLYRKGYYDIRVVDVDDDEIEVLACRKRRLFKLDIRLRSGRIDDIDRKGRCGPRRRSGRDGVHIAAPFADVRTGSGRVDVEVPFAGVHVGQGELRIRAPFVDLRIPR